MPKLKDPRRPKDEVRLKWDAEAAFKRINLERENVKAFGRALTPEDYLMKQPYTPPSNVAAAKLQAPIKQGRDIASLLRHVQTVKGLTDDDALRAKFGTPAAPKPAARWVRQTMLNEVTAVARVEGAVAYMYRPHQEKPFGQSQLNSNDWIECANERKRGCQWIEEAEALALVEKLRHGKAYVTGGTSVNPPPKKPEGPPELGGINNAQKSAVRWGISIKDGVLFRFDPEPNPEHGNGYSLGRHYYPGKSGWDNSATYVPRVGENMTPELSNPDIKLLPAPEAFLWLLNNGYRTEAYARMPVLAWKTTNGNIVRLSVVNSFDEKIAYWVKLRDKEIWESHGQTYTQLHEVLKRIVGYGDQWTWLDDDKTREATESLSAFCRTFHK